MLRLTEWRQGIEFLTPPTWDPGIVDIIHSQDSIGWKNLLEGLPSKLWLPHIHNYYVANGVRRNPTTWMQKFLSSLHDLAWGQWDHRNQILHHIDTPCQSRAITHLDTVIAQEFHSCTINLPPILKPFFASSLGSLIFQNLQYKQAWYLNLLTAKQHYGRLASLSGNPPQANTHPDDRLLKWIKTGYYS